MNTSGPIPLIDAVRTHVHPGESVYIGNFGAQLFAVGHTLIREELRDLHIICGSGGLLMDQLIGAEVASVITFAHCWNPVGPNPAWNLRRAAEASPQTVEIREFSFGMLTAALQAGAWGVPFQPVAISDRTGYVTDGWTRGGVARVSTEFGDAFVVRAIRPDVAFLHADLADQHGNAWLTDAHGEHLFAAQAATRTIVVAERVLPRGEHPATPATLAGAHVTAVVEAPGAAAPDGTPERYPRDVAAYARYATDSRTVESFAGWLAAITAVGA
jgi:glutaconate CoA-transferase subunit A